MNERDKFKVHEFCFVIGMSRKELDSIDCCIESYKKWLRNRRKTEKEEERKRDEQKKENKRFWLSKNECMKRMRRKIRYRELVRII